MSGSFKSTVVVSFPTTLIGILNGSVRHFTRQLHTDVLGRSYIEYLESHWEVVPFQKEHSQHGPKKYSAIRWIGGRSVVGGNLLLQDDQLSFFD
ncbi:hypothetical protein [Paenibacillus sp. FSL L8-0709]|uniref:hypothetical protein n=1 Tax=Paenibacillus sp. FSL L8-0709 TaxID=2975312 RepID=UPI0030F4F123